MNDTQEEINREIVETHCNAVDCRQCTSMWVKEGEVSCNELYPTTENCILLRE